MNADFELHFHLKKMIKEVKLAADIAQYAARGFGNLTRTCRPMTCIAERRYATKHIFLAMIEKLRRV